LHQFETTMEFLQRYIDLAKDKPKRNLSLVGDDVAKPRGTYHLYSVTEAVINALIHRDLALRDIRTRINIYDNAIEFINPRRTRGFSRPATRAMRCGHTAPRTP